MAILYSIWGKQDRGERFKPVYEIDETIGGVSTEFLLGLLVTRLLSDNGGDIEVRSSSGSVVLSARRLHPDSLDVSETS